MKTKPQIKTMGCKPEHVSQLRVRCDLRAGDDLATCQFNLNKWRDRYFQAFNEAQRRGCV